MLERLGAGREAVGRLELVRLGLVRVAGVRLGAGRAVLPLEDEWLDVVRLADELSRGREVALGAALEVGRLALLVEDRAGALVVCLDLLSPFSGGANAAA